jgi:hypothetical protein
MPFALVSIAVFIGVGYIQGTLNLTWHCYSSHIQFRQRSNNF